MRKIDIENEDNSDGGVVSSQVDNDPDFVLGGYGMIQSRSSDDGMMGSNASDSNASDTLDDERDADNNVMMQNYDNYIIESFAPGESDIIGIDVMNVNVNDNDNDIIETNAPSESNSQRQELDFLKDDPSEMTNGRRIALALMNKPWYYPKDDNRTMEEDGVELIGERRDAPSLEKAWAFFEHMVLPRFIVDGQPKKNKAEAGQRFLPTKLYNPLFSTIDDLNGFGLGIQLYFRHLRAIMLLLFIAGLISLPNIIYFSGPEYSNNQIGVPWSLKGSAVCTEYEFVPCLDCNVHHVFAEEEGAHERYRNERSPSGEDVVFAMKNLCEGATIKTIISHLITMFVVIFGLVIISYYIGKQEKSIDDKEQTVKDYTVEILNPPEDTGPEEWKEYFTTNGKFEDIDVICCTVAVDNHDLISNLVQRREILQEIRKALPDDKLPSLEKNDLKKIVDGIEEERGCKLCWTKGLPELYDKLLMLEQKIKDLSVDDKPVTSVFMTFSTESSARQVLNVFRKEKLSFREGGERLRVKPAAEPSAVRWQDLSESRSQIMKSLIVPYVVTLLLLGLSTVLVYFLRRVRGKPVHASFAVSVGNFIFPMVAKALTDKEVHRREGKKQTSLYIKYALFRWVNTVLVMIIITPTTSFLMMGEKDLLPSVYLQFFAEIVFSTGMEITDVVQNVKRHFLAPRAKTQEDMNNYMAANEIDLAERYTTITKILLLSLFYSPLYPRALFYGAFAVLITFHMDKYSLMRSWAPAPKLGRSVSTMNRRFFLSATGIMVALINPYMWAGFNFDNLCAVDEKMDAYFGEYEFLSFNEEANITSTIDSDTQMYRFCEQSLFRRGKPASPRSQSPELHWMSIQQALGTEIYATACISIMHIFARFIYHYIFNSIFCRHKKNIRLVRLKRRHFLQKERKYTYIYLK